MLPLLFIMVAGSLIIYTNRIMVQYTTAIKRFGEQGEKTGWTYIEVPADIAQTLKPGNKKEFKVKGKLDRHAIKRVSLLPMGGGLFIMALNASLRKATGKRHGAMLRVQLEADESPFVFNADFIDCLNDEPNAKNFFQKLPGSHQRYFSKWIDDAKMMPTRAKRIAMAVTALSKKQGYAEMIRSQQKKNPV
jgi:Domain of unknown function (DUF1905)/Bacteriocin-protection, YdeI or OmpD-Associated